MHKQWHQRTNPNYTYRKGNVFYNRRKIPSDLRCHYNRPVFVSRSERPHQNQLKEPQQFSLLDSMNNG